MLARARPAPTAATAIRAPTAVSGACELNVCISCADGAENGSESDVDCGGERCPACADGDACRTPADCLHGACEGGTCCTPNACGACAATPEEVCDGIDNACDGQTDEPADVGPAPLCDEQDGVCAGARADFRRAAGWVCDAATFAAHHAAFESGGEHRCDALDNDCDGAADESLLNPCGSM